MSEQQGEDRQEKMIALIAAGMAVRDGRWINGAPTHIFPEILAELEARRLDPSPLLTDP